MFGFGKKKKRIKALEAHIAELSNSVEEAETTVKAKDEIIQMMLEEKSLQREEMRKLEEEIMLYKAKIKVEEKSYLKAMNKMNKKKSLSSPRNRSKSASGGGAAGEKKKKNILKKVFSPRRKSLFGGLKSDKSKKSSDQEGGLKVPDNTNDDNDDLKGAVTLECSSMGVPYRNQALKIRQSGRTLPGCKSEVVKCKPGEPAEFPALTIKVTDINEKKVLQIEVWNKGTFRSKPVAVVDVSLSDLLSLYKSQQSAEYNLHLPSKKRRGSATPRRLSTRGATNSMRTSTSSMRSKKDLEQMTLVINQVVVQAPSLKDGKQSGKGQSRNPGEIVSKRGVALDDIIGRWTDLGGDYFYVTKKGRVLDRMKHCFGQITIASNEDYDLGMVNQDEGGAFRFASLEKGRLKWSDDETWLGRNRDLIVFDDDDDDDAQQRQRQPTRTSNRSLRVRHLM
mmetsp:Transcript_14873/g.28055  ORF Transcript_14873/g.28055 Transcript_14873/m.28055 type:complete len:450 (+) Transcript_14873:157-1506(+)